MEIVASETLTQGQPPIPEKDLTPANETPSLADTGSPIESFPDKSILELKDVLSERHWLDEQSVEVFKKGELVLHDLSSDTLRKLIGLNSTGEIVATGFRFADKPMGDKLVTSEPNLLAQDFENHPNEPFKSIVGRVEITTSQKDNPVQTHNFTLIIEGINLVSTNEGENPVEKEEVFNLTVIPDDEYGIEDCHKYYSLVAENLKAS